MGLTKEQRKRLRQAKREGRRLAVVETIDVFRTLYGAPFDSNCPFCGEFSCQSKCPHCGYPKDAKMVRGGGEKVEP
jgi:hypothetical protein